MPPLTPIQRELLSILEPRLKDAIKKNDLEHANHVVAEIQKLLQETGHEMRLIQSKNRLFEAHMENGNYDFAIKGFVKIRTQINKNTRTYLEASVLLAICYIRKKEIQLAEPIIQEVLKNDKVIKSKSRRLQFRKTIIERFDEEGILFGIRGEGKEVLEIDDINSRVAKIMHLNEEQIFGEMGLAVPLSAINILLRIDNFSKKQLPSGERKLIAAPIANKDSEKIGKTLFSSVKRVLYNSICDPKSDIYQAWFNNGLKVVLEKNFIVTAVVMILTNLGIGIKMIATTIIALITKFGIEVFCDRYKPDGIMELR